MPPRLFSPEYTSHRQRDDQEKLDPKRLFFIAFEGNITEPDYFKGLKEYIEPKFDVRLFPLDRHDTNSHPKNVLNGLQEYYSTEIASRFRKKLDDELWIIIDIDQHFKSKEVYSAFLMSLHTKDGNVIHAAISNPSFELWLILHFRSADQLDIMALHDNKKVTSSKTYAKKLLNTLLQETSQKDISEYFPRTEQAIRNAESNLLVHTNEALITSVGTTVSKLLRTIIDYDSIK